MKLMIIYHGKQNNNNKILKLILNSITLDKAQENQKFGKLIKLKYQKSFSDTEFDVIYCISHTLHNVVSDILSICKFTDIDDLEINNALNNIIPADNYSENDSEANISETEIEKIFHLQQPAGNYN